MRSIAVSIMIILSLAPGLSAQAPGRQAPAHHVATAPEFRLPPGLFDRGNGRLGAEGQGYRAILDETGIRLEAAPQAGRPATPRLELSFVAAFRSGQPIIDGVATLPEASGLMATYGRAGLAERYAVRSSALEQMFEIPQRLPGTGDLIIRLHVAGNVLAPAWSAPRHAAIEFSLDGNAAIRYGEATCVDRTGGRTNLKTAWDGVEQLDLIVPEEVLASGTYPLLVDPAIGPVFSVGFAPSNDNHPAVAHDPEHGTWAVAWQRVFSTDSDVRLALFDENGTAITSSISIENSPALDARNPSIAFFRGNGNLANNRFLVAWSQQLVGGNTALIMARLVSAQTGLQSGPAFAVSFPLAGNKDDRPAVAGGPPMLVAWDRTPPGGTLSTSIKYRTLHWANPANPGAVTVESERTLTSVTSGQLRAVRLAQSSLTTLVSGLPWSIWRATWEHFFPFPAPGDTDIETASFRTRTGVSAPVALQGPALVPGASTIGVSEIAPDIAVMASGVSDVGGAHYLVAWEESGEIRGQIYSTNATTGSGFAIQPAGSSSYFHPAVGAGACEFTVAYLKQGSTLGFDFDVFGARVLPDGTVPANARLIDNPGPVFQDGIRVSSRPLTLSSGSHQRNTSLVTWMSQTGPAGGINDLRARFFEPLAASANPFGTACAGPGGTLPTIDYSGGLPHPGNLQFAITLSNAPPSSTAVLVLGTSPINVAVPGAPGCFGYVGPTYLFLTTSTSSAGTASFPLPIPCASFLQGVFVASQWAIVTPGFNTAGLVLSNDLDIVWFH